MITCCPVVICPSIPLNDFSSVTPGPGFFKLHLEPSVKGGLKICINGHSPLIKIKEVKHFSFNQNFVLRGLSALAPVLYTCIQLCNF